MTEADLEALCALPTAAQREALQWAKEQAANLCEGGWESFHPSLVPDVLVLVDHLEHWARVARRAADGTWHWGGAAMPLPYWGEQ